MSKATEHDQNKVRILIVDDSDNLRIVIRRYLEKAQTREYQFIFFEAANGQEAEKVLQVAAAMNEAIDVVFLDWMMPTMTGKDLLEKIRSIELFKEYPSVIMLTAETNSEQINVCLKYNVAKYVLKPFTQEILASVLYEVLAGKSDGGIRYAV